MFALINAEGHIIRVLDCSEEEAIGVLEADAVLHPLTGEEAELAMSLPCELVEGAIVARTIVSPANDFAERSRRDALLANTDWTQLPDAPIPLEDAAAWTGYRQALRDLPEDPNWPVVTWPDPPTKSQ